MYDPIRRITAWLLELVLGPGTGRHRVGTGRRRAIPVPARSGAAPAPRAGWTPGRLPVARSPYGLEHPLDGGASALVRPYLPAEDRRGVRRRRRLALVLAADFGVDLDPHVLGASEVAA
ncbi:hypothetical protein G3I34_29980 [Streptomyces sp. SID8014]|nr:hypothetical protein [Streptomyces sp. SID8014]NEC16424.1 hypothetical protein [Streptomyces sp. SID8014]